MKRNTQETMYGDSYFEVWLSDKGSILECMIANMTADLNAGYYYFGNSITSQRENIENYKKEIDSQLHAFYCMTDEEVNRWCYYDLLARGAIA